MALLPRLVSLGRYATVDELMWVYRSVRFREALLAQNWAGTIQTGHPGITTQWLGAFGVQLTLWFQSETYQNLDWLHRIYFYSPLYGEPLQQASPFLTGGRVMVMIVTSLAIVGIYLLLVRSFGEMPAFIAGILLAFTPFFTGLSGMLHTDALLGSFILLSILLLLPQPTPRRAFLCGLTTALGVVTKLPGVILMGFIPLMILYDGWRKNDWGGVIKLWIIWLIPCVVGIVVLLPALIGAPQHVVNILLDSGVDEATMRSSTFFMGQSYESVSAFLFYPVVLLLRLSPAAFIGLIISFYVLWQKKKEIAGIFSTLDRYDLFRRLSVIAFLFSLLFVTGLSSSVRVFERYLLVVIIFWTMIAGLGMGLWLTEQKGNLRHGGRWVVLFFAGIFTLSNFSYPLFGYNWLLGGQTAANFAINTGFGEVHSVAARWLTEQQISETMYVTNTASVAPFYEGEVIFLTEQTAADITPDDWIVLALDSEPTPQPLPVAVGDIQTGFTPNKIIEVGTRRLGLYTGISATDLHVASIPMRDQRHRFDETVQIESVGTKVDANNVSVRVTWRIITPEEYTVVFFVEDDAKHVWVRSEQRLVSRLNYPAFQWSPEQTYTNDYLLPLPVDAPPGNYRVGVTVFDRHGAMQGVYDEIGGFIGVSAPIATVAVTQPDPQPPLTIPNFLQGGDELVGFEKMPASIKTGESLTLSTLR